jgi:hypothetical protein
MNLKLITSIVLGVGFSSVAFAGTSCYELGELNDSGSCIASGTRLCISETVTTQIDENDVTTSQNGKIATTNSFGFRESDSAGPVTGSSYAATQADYNADPSAALSIEFYSVHFQPSGAFGPQSEVARVRSSSVDAIPAGDCLAPDADASSTK